MRNSKPRAFTRRDFVKCLTASAGTATSLLRGLAQNPPPAPGPILLQDTAPHSGLDFILRNDAAGRKYQVETVLGGLGVIDFDADGWPDLYCVNAAALPSLKHNLGRGKMKEVGIEAGVAYNGDGRQISGMAADFRDFDGDGRPDIVMTALHGETFELFRNLGDGTFEDASAQSGLLGLSLPLNGWGGRLCRSGQ